MVMKQLVLLLMAALLAPLAASKPQSDGQYHHFHQSQTQSDAQSLYAYYARADFGCALCRNSANCSLAVHNKSAGVFCGDVLTTLRPCCCSFRNECVTTIFSDSCECLDAEQEQQLLDTRFYLFVVLTGVAWALLVYDKMCAGPYKVMNSNHQALASTPSNAVDRDIPTAADDEDERDGGRHDGVGEGDTLRPRHDAAEDSENGRGDSEQVDRAAPASQEMERIEVSVVEERASPRARTTPVSPSSTSRDGMVTHPDSVESV